jgi:hypothetical protein
MRIQNQILNGAFWFLLVLPAFAAEPALVVDRGLPQVNLNNSSGAARSNVRWSGNKKGFIGDTFVIGAPGERWVIDGIRTWTVPGGKGIAGGAHLGDLYQDVRLYFGAPSGLTPIASGLLAAGGDQTSNPRVRLSPATQAIPYDDFGTSVQVWQIDFDHLNLPVEGGAKYAFGVWGMGRPVPGHEGKTYQWFNHASNAELSGARQDGADGMMLQFGAGGKFKGAVDSKGNGWDKSSDINVQIFAHRAAAGESASTGQGAAQ